MPAELLAGLGMSELVAQLRTSGQFLVLVLLCGQARSCLGASAALVRSSHDLPDQMLQIRITLGLAGMLVA